MPSLYTDPIPSDWPAEGTLHGKPINLEEARRTLSQEELGEVRVLIPGMAEPIRPWHEPPSAILDDGRFFL